MRSDLIGGLSIAGLIVGAALLSLIWTPYDVTELAMGSRLTGPSFDHWLGTDQLGRDVLSMVMIGARVTLGVAVSAIAIGAGIGVPLGLLAAIKRGLADDLVMRANDLVFAFPALLLAILLSASLGSGALCAILAIGIFNIPIFARITRGSALVIWQRDYILAARVAGKSATEITVEHVLPNISGTILIQATIQFAFAIAAEAGLAYLGIGAQPPLPSWGRMLSDAQTMISFAPWLAIFPGLAIAASVLALNLIGGSLKYSLSRS
jgi:peptide/nickel transport system permease protein